MPAEVDYAEKVLALTLTDARFIGEVRGVISDEFILSRELRAMLSAVTDYYEKNDGALATRAILCDVLRDKAGMGAEAWGTLYDRLIDQYVAGDEQHLSFYAQRLEEGWRAETIKKNVLSAVEKLKLRDVDGAVEELYKEWPRARNAFIQGNLVNDLFEVSTELDARAKTPHLWEGIPMGFPTLDEATGGHGRGELVVVIGGTGVGKSLTLGQVAVNVARRGKRVLLVTVENNKWSYMNRLYANISQVPYWKFKRHQLDQHDKGQWLQAMDALHPDFCLDVVEFTEGCSARDIWFYMRQAKHHYDYVVADQITNMLPNDPKDHKPMSWQWYGQISLDLKRLAASAYGNRGVPVLTAAQAGGGLVGKAQLSTDDIAFGKVILHHAHGGLYITRDDEGLYTMGANKWRDAKVDAFPVYPEFKFWQVSEALDMGGRITPPSAPTPKPRPDTGDIDDFGSRVQ
jgi:hypothetical protein